MPIEKDRRRLNVAALLAFCLAGFLLISNAAQAQIVGANGGNGGNGTLVPSAGIGGAGGVAGDASATSGAGGVGGLHGAGTAGGGPNGGATGALGTGRGSGGGNGSGGGGGSTSGVASGGAGGGGGGGGLGATLNGIVTNGATITGGAGGTGGDAAFGGSFWSGGGGGGGGGAGVVMQGTVLTNNGTIAGGAGGNGGIGGGSGSTAIFENGGGGLGGTGIDVSNAAGVSILNFGVIQGGAGGIGTPPGGGNPSTVAAGGAGITGQNLTIVNAGTIAGGSAANAITFTGGTNVLEIRGGSVTSGAVAGGGTTDTLRLGGSAGGAFDIGTLSNAGQFQNFEQLEKVGSSTWTVTGTATFAGPLGITDGLLVVNGILPLATTINGGRLGGVGTLGDVTVNTGGTLAPGNSIGTITVAGNLTFAPGSIYAVEVNPTTSDRTVVTGTATLNGGTVAVTTMSGAYQPTMTYTILTATGGVTGAFAGLSVAGYSPSFFTPSLSYGANAVLLTLLYTSNSFIDAAATPNQRAVAGAMNALGQNAPLLSAFTNLTTTQAQAAFDSLSGEQHASVQAALAQPSLFASTLRDHMLTGFDWVHGAGTPLGYAPENTATLPGSIKTTKAAKGAQPAATTDLSRLLWLTAAGRRASIGSDDNAASQDTTALGLFGGIDIPVSPDVLLCVAGGWSRTNADVDGRASSARTQAWHLATTGAAAFGGVRLRGFLDYSGLTIDTDRTVVVGALRSLASSSYGGQRVEGLGEIGYAIPVRAATVEPFAGLGVSFLHLNGFTETGAGAANLVAGSQDETAAYSSLGLRIGGRFAVSDTLMLTPQVEFAWRHAFSGVTVTRDLAFATSPATPWTVSGTPLARDVALLGASLKLDVTDTTALAVRYTGQIGGETREHTFTGSLTHRF